MKKHHSYKKKSVNQPFLVMKNLQN